MSLQMDSRCSCISPLRVDENSLLFHAIENECHPSNSPLRQVNEFQRFITKFRTCYLHVERQNCASFIDTNLFRMQCYPSFFMNHANDTCAFDFPSILLRWSKPHALGAELGRSSDWKEQHRCSLVYSITSESIAS